MGDALVILLLPLTATLASELLNLNFLWSTVLYFAVPSVYLSLRSPQHVKKTLLWTLIPWLSVSFIFEYLAYTDQAWYVNNSVYRFLGNSFPIEDVLWGFLWSYLPIIFWKHFLDQKSRYEQNFPGQIRWLIGLLVAVNSIFFWFYFWHRDMLVMPYFYLVMGAIFCIAPLVLFLWQCPQFLGKLLLLSAYFTFLAGLKEYIALKLNYWYFPGTHFIATVSFAGQKLPWEEIIFFWILSAPAMVAWYEYFADDQQ